MKIVCESCQAKYSIADEKIAGKVFKIRCKRCNEVILVRGDHDPVQEASIQESQNSANDAIWHIVIEGEQRGPFAPDQIGEMLSTGQIDWEAYVWREGMENWLAACDIPELVSAVMGPDHVGQQGEQAAAAYDQTGGVVQPAVGARAMANNPIQTNSTMGADPFADNGGGGGLFADSVGNNPGADLFRPSADNPFASSGGGEGFSGNGDLGGGGPRVNMDQAMTGARNENSVLFSLKNLQALATGSTSAPVSSPIASPQSSGYAAGEGSGLIDIRALASATGVTKDGMHEEDRDMLLSIGSKTGAFGALGSPMVSPSISADEDTSKKKLLFAVLGGSIFLGMCMIAVAIILKPSAQPQPTVAPVVAPAVAPAAEAAKALEANPSVAPTAASAELSEGEKAARAAAEADRSANSDRGSRSVATASSKKKSTKEEASPKAVERPAAAAPAVAAKEEPAKKKKSTGSESIDDLLSGAISGSKPAKKAAAEEPSAAASGLPEKPSRDDVMSALRSVQPEVSACGAGQGVAMAAIVVGNSGRVQSVQVTQVPGPVASCVARAVRGARFPKFSAPKFSVSFPFRL
jgi:predicted Zn finger-like uncharacterized protein